MPRLDSARLWVVSGLVFALWTTRNNQPIADLMSFICAGAVLTLVLTCVLFQIIVKWTVLDRRLSLARKRLGIQLFVLLDRIFNLTWGVGLVICLYLSIAAKDWTRAWILAGVGLYLAVMHVLVLFEARRNQQKAPAA
jgi:hypothetical protein